MPRSTPHYFVDLKPPLKTVRQDTIRVVFDKRHRDFPDWNSAARYANRSKGVRMIVEVLAVAH